MSLVYSRKGNEGLIRLGYWHDKNEYVVYVGKRIYGIAYNIGDAYRLYNEVR